MKNIKVKDIIELFDDCYINLYDDETLDYFVDGNILGKDESITYDEYWSIVHKYDNYKVNAISPLSEESITLFIEK